MTRIYEPLLLMILLAIAGCSSFPQLPSDERVAAAIGNYQPPHAASAEMAQVYVIRPSWVFGLVRFGVYVDGKDVDSRIGHNRTREYVHFEIEPGEHTIYSRSSNWSELDVVAKAGETLYIEQAQNAFATNKLILLSPHSGQYRVMNTKPGTFERTGD